MLVVIMSGLLAGALLQKTAYFLGACFVISIFFGFSNSSKFAESLEYRDDLENENKQKAIAVAWFHGVVVGFIVSVASGGILKLFL